MSRPYGRRPPYRRRDRLGFAATMWLIVFGAILGAALVLSSPRAHGDTGYFDVAAVDYVAAHPAKVCNALTREPTVDSLTSVALDIYTHSHLTIGQTGQVINLSVRATCPQAWPILEAFTGQHTPMPPLTLPTTPAPKGVVA
jgi:hypothetical protein